MVQQEKQLEKSTLKTKLTAMQSDFNDTFPEILDDIIDSLPVTHFPPDQVVRLRNMIELNVLGGVCSICPDVNSFFVCFCTRHVLCFVST